MLGMPSSTQGALLRSFLTLQQERCGLLAAGVPHLLGPRLPALPPSILPVLPSFSLPALTTATLLPCMELAAALLCPAEGNCGSLVAQDLCAMQGCLAATATLLIQPLDKPLPSAPPCASPDSLDRLVPDLPGGPPSLGSIGSLNTTAAATSSTDESAPIDSEKCVGLEPVTATLSTARLLPALAQGRCTSQSTSTYTAATCRICPEHTSNPWGKLS